MSTITIKQVTKAFGDVVVLKEFNEVFQDKEFITLLGPSGCGKTTMLRMIAGFEKPTSGEISIDGRVVSSEKTFVPPEKRDIGMVFQSYAVWPHMTVFDNVAYPLKIKKLDKAAIKQKVEWILEAVHLSQYADRMPEADMWADKAQACFDRDAALMDDYNNNIAGGKWRGMMVQKHIGYTSWNDDFPCDVLPTVYRLDGDKEALGGYRFPEADDCVVMEAEHFNKAVNPAGEGKWTVIPYMGRTLSGVSVMPYTTSVDGARLDYSLRLPEGTDSVTVHVITKSTLAFARPEGHRYTVGFEGTAPVEVNFNSELNEKPENIHTVYYPTIARRVIEKTVTLPVPTPSADGTLTLSLSPLDPGVVFEKIVVDAGGYRKSYLFGEESPVTRKQ